jgi:uncharacterized membrane protein YgaE (UPF0421/DUF939 family)
MNQVVELTTNILKDLKGISDIQQASMFLGGASGALVGGLFSCASAEAAVVGAGAVGAEAAAVGVGAVGAEAAAVGVGAVGASASGASTVMLMGTGGLIGILIGLGIGTAVQAYLNNKEREKLRKELEMQKEIRLKRIMENSNSIIAKAGEDGNVKAGKQVRKLISFYQDGVFNDDTFLGKIQQICLENCGLSNEEVKALEPLPV